MRNAAKKKCALSALTIEKTPKNRSFTGRLIFVSMTPIYRAVNGKDLLKKRIQTVSYPENQKKLHTNVERAES